MNVLYDISVVVQGQHEVLARTGVFRVAENVAAGLASHPECDLKFCVAQTVTGALDFLAADERFRHVPVTQTRAARLWRNIPTTSRLPTRQSDSSGTRPLTIPARISRRLRNYSARTIAPFVPPLAAEALATADIYHSPFYPLPSKLRNGNLKNFLTVYDLIPVLHPEFFGVPMNVLGLKILDSIDRDDYVLCISQATKDDLCSFKGDLDPARVMVTHLASSELFYPCKEKPRIEEVLERYGIPRDGSYLLSLSTLEPRKNIEQVVKSFAQLVREQSLTDLRLVLAGSKGWDYDKILDAARRFSISTESIIFTGYVSDEDLAPLYSGALAFVYLSFYEGFGLPPLEAMQCGTPVITSNTSSLPEVVGDAGIMLDPSDQDGVSQAILDLYRSETLRQKLSHLSLERARLFSWERCVRETVEAYKEALAG
jgi:glycosyltransferase involved in cell wall biosynthesis